MGALCGCCSRNQVTITTDTAQNDERQAMLNTNDNIQKSKHETIDDSKQYGATSQSNKINTKYKSNKIEEKDTEQDDEKIKKLNKISISQTNLIITNAGFNQINGDYRWFIHNKKWCLFRENISYSMENGVSVDDVYNQLIKLQAKEANFRWNENIKKCWIISNMEGTAIYYAAPQNKEYDTMDNIPNDNKLWISVHGSLPGPDIFANLAEDTKPPDDTEEFGNVTPRDNSFINNDKNKSVASLQSITETMDGMNDEEDDESLSDLDGKDGDDGKVDEVDKSGKEEENGGGDKDEEDEEDEDSLSDLND